MGSLAGFKSTYLNPAAPILPIGVRQQLAGPIYSIERQVADGATYGAALNNVVPKARTQVAFAAQYASSPYNANLVSDFLTINAA
jgi:hypothetical protein